MGMLKRVMDRLVKLVQRNAVKADQKKMPAKLYQPMERMNLHPWVFDAFTKAMQPLPPRRKTPSMMGSTSRGKNWVPRRLRSLDMTHYESIVRRVGGLDRIQIVRRVPVAPDLSMGQVKVAA